MSLADYIISERLNDFRDQCPTVNYPDWFVPSDNNRFTYDQIKSITRTQIEEIQTCLSSASKLSSENRAHNSKILQRLCNELKDMMSTFGVSVDKNDTSMYAHYAKLIDDIKEKYKLGSHGAYHINYKASDGGQVFSVTSYTVSEWCSRLLREMDDARYRSNKDRRELIENISYCVENGIETRNFNSNEELLEATNKFKRDASIHSKFPVGLTDRVLSCNLAPCSFKHGDQFGHCNRTQLAYRFMSGDTEWTDPIFYSLSSWDSVDAQRTFRHPNVTDPIPF